jgi:quinol monooxygenase YgiN
MFARIVEFIPKLEKKEEFVKVVRNEVLPILKKQPGFLEFLPFVPETKFTRYCLVCPFCM